MRRDDREASGWFTRGFALEATIPYAILSPKLWQHDSVHNLIPDFSALSGDYGWLFPNGDHTNIGIGVSSPDSSEDQLKQVNRNSRAGYIRRKLGLNLNTTDPVITRVTGQHLGMGGHRYIPRGRPLLLGDASGLVDPLTGEGIHSAITSGQAAAAAILSCEENIAAAYALRLAPLQQTLAFSHSVARTLYSKPKRGFCLLRSPMVRNLVLKTYANGADYTRLRARLAKFIACA